MKRTQKKKSHLRNLYLRMAHRSGKRTPLSIRCARSFLRRWGKGKPASFFCSLFSPFCERAIFLLPWPKILGHVAYRLHKVAALIGRRSRGGGHFVRRRGGRIIVHSLCKLDKGRVKAARIYFTSTEAACLFEVTRKGRERTRISALAMRKRRLLFRKGKGRVGRGIPESQTCGARNFLRRKGGGREENLLYGKGRYSSPSSGVKGERMGFLAV